MDQPRPRQLFLALSVVLAVLSTARAEPESYESAKYEVIEKDGAFEIRQYPDLMLATTKMKSEGPRASGSFMRLFQYISGANLQNQKIAMTTPVFTETAAGNDESEMGFVVPNDLAEKSIPEPSNKQVHIKKRKGGKFAVIRFNGYMNANSVSQAEKSLRDWIKGRGITGEKVCEFAGYDAPGTPARLRRNEVLIRLKPLLESPGETLDDLDDPLGATSSTESTSAPSEN